METPEQGLTGTIDTGLAVNILIRLGASGQSLSKRLLMSAVSVSAVMIGYRDSDGWVVEHGEGGARRIVSK